MKLLFNIILIFIAVALILICVQFAKINACIRQGNYDLKPWQRIKPEAGFKVLFAGDSTAVGTGLLDNAQSTAGLLGRDHPDFDVENYSRNGLRLKGLIDILKGLQDKRFDLAVLQIGANDILYFTPIGQIMDEHQEVLNLARHMAKRVIILHSGDIAEAPIFIWPFTWIYTWRSLKVREIYSRRQDDRVAYIDIYALNKGKDFSDCYASDRLHLNKNGYAIWYGYIRDQLEKRHWV